VPRIKGPFVFKKDYLTCINIYNILRICPRILSRFHPNSDLDVKSRILGTFVLFTALLACYGDIVKI